MIILLLSLPVFLLSAMLAVCLYQELVVFARCKAGLQELNAERARRVSAALAAEPAMESIDSVSDAQYPFDGFVELTEHGVRIAGQLYSPVQAFEVSARDSNNISRAEVSCTGDGAVMIFSHGEHFIARLNGGEWAVAAIKNEVK